MVTYTDSLQLGLYIYFSINIIYAAIVYTFADHKLIPYNKEDMEKANVYEFFSDEFIKMVIYGMILIVGCICYIPKQLWDIVFNPNGFWRFKV